MPRITLLALAPVAILAACAQTGDAPSVPGGAPVSGRDIPALVDGGPYALRIFDGDLAGTTGQTTWDFGAGTVSGSFTTAGGESGTFSQPLEIDGNQACAGAGDARTCHFIYPYADGFMEVTPGGAVHAISTPM